MISPEYRAITVIGITSKPPVGTERASWATRIILFLSLNPRKSHRPHTHFLDLFVVDGVQEGIITLPPHFVFAVSHKSGVSTASRHRRWWWFHCTRQTRNSSERWNSRPEREGFPRSDHAGRSFLRWWHHASSTPLSHCGTAGRSFHPRSGRTRWSVGHSGDSRRPFGRCQTWMGLETCGDDRTCSHTLGMLLSEKERSNTCGTERYHTHESGCKAECHRKTECTQSRLYRPGSTSSLSVEKYLCMQSIQSIGWWIYSMCGTVMQPPLKKSVNQIDLLLLLVARFCVEYRFSCKYVFLFIHYWNLSQMSWREKLENKTHLSFLPWFWAKSNILRKILFIYTRQPLRSVFTSTHSELGAGSKSVREGV